MSMIRLAELFRQRLTEKEIEHHAKMDKGQSPEQYNRLVGRNQQIKECRTWVTEILGRLDSEEGEDSL